MENNGSEIVDARLEKLKGVIELFNNHITPDEVGQAIMLVFQVMSAMNDEINRTFDLHRANSSTDYLALRNALDAATRDGSKKIGSVRRLVDGLLAWQEEQQNKTTEDDLTAALEQTDENSHAIRIIRREMKKLQKAPPKDGPPGKMPDHKWEGTRLHFQNPDGAWDDGVDLRGMPGIAHPESGRGPGAGMGGVRRIRAGVGISITGDPGEPTIQATGTGVGHVIQDEGVNLTQRTHLDFVGASVTATDDPDNDATVITISGGSGLGVASETVAAIQSGADVTIALSQLAHTYQSILLVSRNGQVQHPLTEWSISGASITVFNADAGVDEFVIQYSYTGTAAGIATEQLTGTQSGANVTLDLTQLSRTYSSVLLVSRNGQIVTPSASGWTQSVNTITVYNADAGGEFLVQYLY